MTLMISVLLKAVSLTLVVVFVEMADVICPGAFYRAVINSTIRHKHLFHILYDYCLQLKNKKNHNPV